VTATRGIAPVLALALAAAGCGHEPPRQRVALTEEPSLPSPAAVGGRDEVLRLGVASVLSPAASLRHYGELAEYLGEKLGMAAQIVRRPNYAEMNELLRQRYCTLGFFCNYAFVRAQREFGAELLATPVVGGEVHYQAYVIAARDGSVRSFLDLAGRRFAFADPMCTAGWLYPSYRSLELHSDARRFFDKEFFTYSYENSIRAVAEGAADGAGVEAPLYDSLLAEGNPAALKTRIVDRSPPLGTPPVVVHPRLDPVLRAKLRDLLLTLHENERGREILGRIWVDRFVEPDPELYAPIRKMAEAVERP